jgi:hypothetical protein
MKKQSLAFFLAGILLLLAAAVGYLFFRMRSEQVARSEAANLPNAVVNGTFGSTTDLSADDLQMRRLIRGSITSVEDSSFILSTMVNWPQKDRRMNYIIETSPRTEYLCWPSKVTAQGGQEVVVIDATYLLTSESKLFMQGERPLTKAQATELLQKNNTVMVALQENFSAKPGAINTAFQVAILGCLDE